MVRAGGEAGIGEGVYRPGAGEGVAGDVVTNGGLDVLQTHDPPGRRDLGGVVLGQHAADQSVAQGGGQYAGPADETGCDVCLLFRRPPGDVLGKALEQGIDRRPVGRIAGVGLLAGGASGHRRLSLTGRKPESYTLNLPLRDLAMKRFVWFVLGVMLMSLPAPAGATAINDSERVYFASGSAELDDTAKRVLDQVFKVMASFYTDRGLTIDGHTDHKEVPGGRESLALGEKRAQAVKDYLVSKGIAAKRIDIMSYGWYRSAYPNNGDWPKNRRAVMVLN